MTPAATFISWPPPHVALTRSTKIARTSRAFSFSNRWYYTYTYSSVIDDYLMLNRSFEYFTNNNELGNVVYNAGVNWGHDFHHGPIPSQKICLFLLNKLPVISPRRAPLFAGGAEQICAKLAFNWGFSGAIFYYLYNMQENDGLFRNFHVILDHSIDGQHQLRLFLQNHPPGAICNVMGSAIGFSCVSPPGRRLSHNMLVRNLLGFIYDSKIPLFNLGLTKAQKPITAETYWRKNPHFSAVFASKIL